MFFLKRAKSSTLDNHLNQLINGITKIFPLILTLFINKNLEFTVKSAKKIYGIL